jgi:cellulose synthase/poly-beta-1,6-N-acetylglucosamine synthase-like glycosyltransferase
VTALEMSIHRLRLLLPEQSADRTLSAGQLRLLLAVTLGLVVGILVDAHLAAIVLLGLCTVLYALTLGFRFYLLRLALKGSSGVAVSDEEARAIAELDLPAYTVLVPLYREADVIERTVAALAALDYPRDRLDVKLLVEADDDETVAAALRLRSELSLQVVAVPASLPRTKPKACNYGLYYARGELVTIFDAEDEPEPLQLRRAVAAFRRLPASVACLQSRLSYHNAGQNLITKWFTVEYAAWFSMLLPAMAGHGGPAPLGGTSMHLKRDILERVGAWDAHNVTEDADLGVRLQRLGYGIAVLQSTTLEEANSDFVNWVRQRSRWYKGYLLTWLVHMRRPVRLWTELGPQGFIGLNLMIGAAPVLAILNPFFWLITGLWFWGRSSVLQSFLPPLIYYPGLVCMVLGNFLAVYTGLIAVRKIDQPRLLLAALTVPLYWLMMSIAAVRALLQLVVAPSFWEKSVHGLDGYQRIGTADPADG